MVSVVKSFSYDSAKIGIMEKFEDMAAREGRTSSEIIFEMIEKKVKHHGSGNPAYPLDEWLTNPGMMAFPAFAGSQQNWNAYLIQASTKELLDIMRISNLINSKAVRVYDHGKNVDLNQIL